MCKDCKDIPIREFTGTEPGIPSLEQVNELAKSVNRFLSVTRSGSDYYLLKGTSPIDFVEIAHIKVHFPMSHAWAIDVIAGILMDIRCA
jgi:hypothetical protein